MITHLDLIELYNWAKDTEFPVKTAPTIEGYSNKSIDYYWIKSVKKSTLIREKLMTDKVRKIYDNDDILFSNLTRLSSISIPYDCNPATFAQYAILPSPEPMSIISLTAIFFDSKASA